MSRKHVPVFCTASEEHEGQAHTNAGVYAMNAPPVSLHPASNLISHVSMPLGAYTGRHVSAAPAHSTPGAYTGVATYVPFLYTDVHLPLAQRTCPAGARALRTTRIHIGPRQRATQHRAAQYPLPSLSSRYGADSNAVPSAAPQMPPRLRCMCVCFYPHV